LSLAAAGFNLSTFSGHSFHCGTEYSAMVVGFNHYEIQQLGRWSSNSYKLYIESFLACLLSLSSHFHWAIPHGEPFEPLSLSLLYWLE